MEGKYIIGIDAGTSKIKSVLFDDKGNELYVASEDVKLIYPAPGLVEQDMNEAWESTFRTVKELLANVNVNKADIAAIAITGQADGTWLIGEDGEPVCNSYNWTDSRALSKCIEWIMSGKDMEVYNDCGSTFYPGSLSVLMAWMKENEPEVLNKAKYIGGCKDWMKFKFTGVFSGDTSYMFGNPAERCRNKETIDHIGCGEYYDKIITDRPLQDAWDPIKPELAAELGLNEGIPVFGGPFDFVACAIGSGTLNYGDACAVVGTTTNVSFALNEFNPEPLNVGYTICGYADNQWVRAFGVMAGTPNIEWTIGHIGLKYMMAAQQKGTDVYAEIEEAIKDIPVGAGGVIYHPYALPGGERSPFVKPTAKANFFGLGVEHTTDHLMRAVYESIGYSLLDCAINIEDKPDSITIMGGGAKSPLLCQIIADITGMDVVLTQGSEFGAKGTAMAAATSIGMFDTIEDAKAAWVHEAKRFKPNMENNAEYAKYFKLYKAICASMFDLWDMRAGILQGMI